MPRSVRVRCTLSVVAVLAMLAAACGDVEVEADEGEDLVDVEDDAGDDPTDDSDDSPDDPADDPAGDDEIPDDPDAIVIGWTPPDITGVFQTATDYFEESAADAAEHGLDIQVVSRSPETHVDFGDQLAIVEDYITQGVDVIAISPADVEAIKPAINEAEAAGIPVILVNLLEEQDDVEVATYIGFDNFDAAAVSAYALLDHFGGPGVLGDGDAVDVAEDEYLDLDWWEETYADVDADITASGVAIEGIAGEFFSVQRMEGFSSVIAEHDGVELLADPIAGNWNREQGTQAAEDFLTRFGEDELDFVYAASNEMGLGAMLAADAAGRLDSSGGGSPPEEGLISIFTNDVTPESTEAIREGGIVAETWHGFPEWGWYGSYSAARLVCGLDVEQFQDIRPRTVWEGNADQFYPEPELEDLDWEEVAAACG